MGWDGHCNKTLGLMSYSPDRPDSWTDCSKKDFEDWYRETGHACLVEAGQVSCGDTRRVAECKDCGAVLCRGDCRWNQGACGQPGK